MVTQPSLSGPAFGVALRSQSSHAAALSKQKSHFVYKSEIFAWARHVQFPLSCHWLVHRM
jgi:hypothetical protein